MSLISGAYGAAYGQDPHAFVVNVVRTFKRQWVRVTQRVVDRTGVTKWEVTLPDGRKAAIPLKGKSTDRIEVLALRVVGCALKLPVEFADEARRVAMGLPRGLEGQTVEAVPHNLDPTTISAAAAVIAALAPIIVEIAGMVLPALLEWAGDAVEGFLPAKAPAPSSGGSGSGSGSSSKKAKDNLPLFLGAGVLAFLVWG